MFKKLKFMPYAQAQVRILDNGEIALCSYDTMVATISDKGWLYIRGLYSATTRKHLKAFCKEYCGFDTFSTIRLLAKEQMLMNIHTGEIIDA